MASWVGNPQHDGAPDDVPRNLKLVGAGHHFGTDDFWHDGHRLRLAHCRPETHGNNFVSPPWLGSLLRQRGASTCNTSASYMLSMWYERASPHLNTTMWEEMHMYSVCSFSNTLGKG